MGRYLVIYVLFFFHFYSNCQNQIKLSTEELELLGNKTLLFKGNENVTFQKVLSDDLHLDSTLLLNKMEFLEENNLGYRVPTSSELLRVCRSNEYKTPPTKEKISCRKTLICKEMKSLDDMKYENISIHLSAQWGLKKYEHPHPCHCQNWSEQYKSKVACHVCKDERVTYCGKSFTCPICNGKGYRFEDIPEKSELNFENYLQYYQLSFPKIVFYFDTPHDYGVFDMVNIRKIPFGMRIDSSDLNNLSFLLFAGNESVRMKIENYNLLVQKNDKEVSTLIDDFLANGNAEEAANHVHKFMSRITLNYYQKKIQDYLTTKYLNEEVELDKIQIDDFIKNNRDYISKLRIGSYSLKTDTSGNISIDGVALDYKIQQCPTKYFGLKREFNVVLVSSSEIRIEIDTILLKNQTKRYQTFDGYSIKWNKRGKPFKKNFYNGSVFTMSQYLVKTEINKNLSKRTLLTVESCKIEKKANSILLSETTVDRTLKEDKIVSRIPHVITKSLGFSVGAFIGLLRLYEYSLIPK